MASTNTKITNSTIKRAAMVERFKASEARRINNYIRDELSPDLIKQVSGELAVLEGKTLTAKRRRLNSIIKGSDEIVKKHSDDLFDSINSSVFEMGNIEATREVAAINSAIPSQVQKLGFSVSEMKAATIKESVKNLLINGNSLTDTVALFETGFTAQLKSQIGVGFVQGEGVSQITQRIRKTINTQSRHAQSIARTALNGISSDIREGIYKENSDIVKGVRWVSALDMRTTDLCISLDGKVYPVGEGRRPPAHTNCRSTTVPITKSWRELGIDKDDLSPGTRRDMNGSVPANTTYPEWLKGQTQKTQEEVLGVGKAQLFRNGDLDLNKFVNRIGDSLTLDELKARI